MPNSKAIIIFNEESEKRDDLKTISNTLHRLNMSVNVLVNKPAEEIQQAVIELTQMDPNEVLDIVFVINAKQVKEWDRRFSTVDRKIIDLYNNIIYYILEIEEFVKMPKIIIFKVSGRDNGDDLTGFNLDKEYRQLDYGRNCVTIWSYEDEFIEKFFKDLAKHRNLTKTMKKMSSLIAKQEDSTTSGELKLKVPPANAKLTSEFHEFIVG